MMLSARMNGGASGGIRLAHPTTTGLEDLCCAVKPPEKLSTFSALRSSCFWITHLQLNLK